MLNKEFIVEVYNFVDNFHDGILHKYYKEMKLVDGFTFIIVNNERSVIFEIPEGWSNEGIDVEEFNKMLSNAHLILTSNKYETGVNTW